MWVTLLLKLRYRGKAKITKEQTKQNVPLISLNSTAWLFFSNFENCPLCLAEELCAGHAGATFSPKEEAKFCCALDIDKQLYS